MIAHDINLLVSEIGLALILLTINAEVLVEALIHCRIDVAGAVAWPS